MAFGGAVPAVDIVGWMMPVEAAGVVVVSGAAAVLAAELAAGLAAVLADPAVAPALAPEDPVGDVVVVLEGGDVVEVVPVDVPEIPNAKFGAVRAVAPPTAMVRTSSGTDTTAFARTTSAPAESTLQDFRSLLLAVVLRGTARSFVR